MTREDINHVESTTTDRRDYLRILLALAGVGALSTSTTEVAKAAHNSDAPYPSGAWGYAGTAGHGESERPSIAELESAWNETYHVLHQDVDVGSRWYAEDGYLEWDLLPIVWDGLDTPADSEVPAGGTLVEQEESSNAFRLLGIDDDASHYRRATVDWTEIPFGAPIQIKTTEDHDANIAEKGVHHEQPTSTDWAASDVVEKGYPSFDEGGSALELYWPFDEDSGTTANDVSSNNYNGTINGATLGQNGILNTDCYSFDGVDDEVRIGTSNDATDPDIGPLSSLTISVWVKANSVGGDNIIYAEETEASFSNFDMWWDASGFNGGASNTITARVYDGTDRAIAEGESNVQSTNWMHICTRWSTGNAPEILVDGSEIAYSYTQTAGTDVPFDDFFIVGNGFFDPWDGLIDEVRLYSRALSDTEILNLYNAAI